MLLKVSEERNGWLWLIKQILKDIISKSHNLILWLTTNVGGPKPRLQFALVHKFDFKSIKIF